MTRRILIALLLSLLAWPVLAQDRGEQPEDHEMLALGADVDARVGSPSGPSLSGELLHLRTESLASTVRCPVCQGLSVNDSPSESARNMKRQLKAMLAAGYSDDQVLSYFEQGYGEFIRLQPRAKGFNLLVWLLPGALVLVGLGLVLRSTRGGNAPAPAPTEPTAEPTPRGDDLDDWRARVREELDDA